MSHVRRIVQLKCRQHFIRLIEPGMLFSVQIHIAMNVFSTIDTSEFVTGNVDYSECNIVPDRARMLNTLGYLGRYRPMLLLPGSDDDYGSRCTLDGHPVQPVIAEFLIKHEFVADVGNTDFGARILTLTNAGIEFREKGKQWWGNLSLIQRINIYIVG